MRWNDPARWIRFRDYCQRIGFVDATYPFMLSETDYILSCLSNAEWAILIRQYHESGEVIPAWIQRRHFLSVAADNEAEAKGALMAEKRMRAKEEYAIIAKAWNLIPKGIYRTSRMDAKKMPA